MPLDLSNLLQNTQKQLDRLLDLRLKDLIVEDIFKEKNDKLEQEIKQIKEKLRNTEDRTQELNDLTKRAIDFVAQAKDSFQNGDIETKKAILIGLGSNFLLKGRILMFEPHPCLIPIIYKYPEIEDEYLRLEPTKTTANSTLSLKEDRFKNICLKWRGRRDSNSRPHAGQACVLTN